MVLDKIKNNPGRFISYVFTILLSVLLKKSSVYTGLVVFAFVLLLNKSSFLTKLLSFILLTILGIEVIYFLYFHQRISESILESVVETNRLELSRMTTTTEVLLPLLLSLLIAALISFTKPFREKKTKNYLKVIISIAMITLVATDVKKLFFNYRVLPDIQEDNRVLGRLLHDKYPLIIGDVGYFVTMLSNNKYNVYEKKLGVNQAIVGKADHSNDNIVVIMGESSSSLRYHVYGYHINTTPHLGSIFSKPQGCIIPNAHSAAPITRNSVAMTFSFAMPEDEQPLFKEKNIIDLAKDHGYRTYWLSSQQISGLHESKFGYIAKKSDVVRMTRGKDDQLNRFLITALQDKGKKFIVLHMAGSHRPYVNFDNLDEKALPKTNKYDLTIHHTDRVIKAINDTLKQKLNDYILFYTSDHGEVVDVGHGLAGNKEQYLIPLMMLDTKGHALCDYVESLRNKDGYLSGLMNKYIIAHLLGYRLDDNIIKKEIDNDRVIDANNNVLFFNRIKHH